ncbi:MAG: hypothetical protein ACRDRV_19540 [Pseudonocardiaceae bacterium]
MGARSVQVVQISGTLRFPPRGEPFTVTRVHLAVRDVSELDGPARTVAQLDLPGVQVPATGLEVPFTVHAELPDPARTYALRAHADTDGSGSVKPGDLVTTSVHVVGPSGRPAVLPLEPVTD